jgi:hypothetical protein
MELHGRCFKCLSYSHQVATCQLPRRCLRRHGFGHLAKDCKRPRHAMTSAAKGGNRSRHPARGGNSQASQHAPHGGSIGAVQGGAEGACGTWRRRRWRRQSEPVRDVSLGTPADSNNNAAIVAAAAARCFPDPLAVELCVCPDLPAWVDPMLEELAAYVANPPVGAPAPGCSTALVSTSLDVD